MQLKALEMIGFKSFSDKTILSFQQGVTAVVGPNGCGKSNISDAIRWVLGEQSAKHLRGDKMEDVIFNGSESRKPMGMAEVTLRFTNMKGALSSEFGHYEEIDITRRLYRSGESEYLVNKIPCRLKDIRDLMMDAGVGAKLHAIIEQDRVKKIIDSKPEERRFLFEEVAGVMKYKARRQEALSKLEATQQNQLRVNDIIVEVRRQLNSLDRQAKKAERYQNLKAEMKDHDLRLAAVDYSTLGAEWNAATTEFTTTEDELSSLHAKVSTIEAGIEETRADALSAEQELASLRNKIHDTETSLSRSEHRIEMSRGQIAALSQQRSRDIADLEYLKQEINRAAGQKKQHEEESFGIARQIEEQSAMLSGRQDALESLARDVRDREKDLDEARTGAFNAMTEAATEKNRISHFQARSVQINEQDERAEKERVDLAGKVDEITARLSEKERELEEITSQRSAAREAHAQILLDLETATEKKKSLELTLTDARHRFASQSSRLKSLLELEQRLEGYQKGVRTVMSARKDSATGDKLGTIHGLVADMIATEPRYENAIEAVLGDRLQHVVVDSQNDSLKAIDYLKTRSGGRSTFIPLSPREIKSEPFVKNGHAGVIGSALSIVKFDQNYSHVARHLLGDVVVVDTMDTALYLWNKNGFDKTVVTLAGEIVEPSGSVTGGTVETGGAGMLTKRREIKDLEQEVSVLTGRTAELELELASVVTDIDRAQKTAADLSQQIHRMEIELVNREKDKHSLRDDMRRSQERASVLEAETAERGVLLAELATGIEKASDTLRKIEEGHAAAQAEIETLQTQLSLQREALESSRAEITDIRMELTALQEKQASSARNQAALIKMETEFTERLANREKEIVDIGASIAELEASIAEAELEIKALIDALEEERKLLTMRQESHAAVAAALHATEEEARQVRHAIETAQKKLSACEIKRTELRMKIEHLKDRIWSAYHMPLEAVVTELGEFEIELDESKRKLDELRQKIDQMGPVNIEALQEYAELKERYDLQSSQLNDINESIANLKATIAKLDVETKELFSEAFTAIHEKFKEVFPRLFEGGKAELVLLDPTNILESGIEIIAQPRGKKFQHMSLLSGGEKALTSIALLFAAFLVKPSPFCLLDEADAPLDAANVMRFTRLIHEMSSRSQFITITHKTGTMEMADALYGITMDEPGCSRVVSVKFREPAMA